MADNIKKNEKEVSEKELKKVSGGNDVTMEDIINLAENITNIEQHTAPRDPELERHNNDHNSSK